MLLQQAEIMPAKVLDPRSATIAVVELSDVFSIPVAVVSSPEYEVNGRKAMTTVEQLTDKLKPDKENRIISIVDFRGSTSGNWTGEKIRHLDDNGVKIFHSQGLNGTSRSARNVRHTSNPTALFSEKAGGDQTQIIEKQAKGMPSRIRSGIRTGVAKLTLV